VLVGPNLLASPTNTSPAHTTKPLDRNLTLQARELRITGDDRALLRLGQRRSEKISVRQSPGDFEICSYAR